MKGISLRYLVILCFISIVLSCKVTRPYNQLEVTRGDLFRGTTGEDTNSIVSLPWNEIFTDTILQQLIRTGINQNFDLQMAFTRITQAEAYYRQSRAAFLPTIDANGTTTISKFPEALSFGRPPTQYQLGLTAGWEIDIWGRLRSARRANLANLLQSQTAARAVQTGMVASIANLYYALMALDQQLAITEETVRNWDTTVQTMRALKEAARVTEAAVVQSEAQRYAAEVTIPDLRQSIRETEHAISILTGASPAAVPRSRLAEQPVIDVLEVGVPAQLLANRPDVQQAELNYRYFFELTNAARTYFYPSLNITATAGLTSVALGTLISPSALAASIGAGLTQPIFNRRLNRTRLEVAEAQQQEAYLNFQNVLLNAGQEVSDALSLFSTAREKMNVRSRQMDALEKSVAYSQELLRNGFATYPEVITARQSLLQAELGSVNDRLQQYQAVVSLYRSLGGGWR
jgi:outer membrane protein, multidrug efflux system